MTSGDRLNADKLSMANDPHHSLVDEAYDFQAIKQRFININSSRLARIDADLRGTQKDFLKLLPLFFHVNHPLLPGYVSKETPLGIPQYMPDNHTLHAAKRLSRSFEIKKRAYRQFDIQAIYLMGSSGTIAYSDKSDFDIWICHSETLTAEQITELELKTQAVEEWAKSFGVDANLYLVNPEKLRQGEHGFLTNESSGSALDSLLLEEFYRTSVLIAGRYPLWWMVPPEFEHEYDEYVASIKDRRYIHGKESVDFGGLKTVAAEEFYGATLWLLYKGINAPYKTILKILLMQSYVSEFPQIDLLGMHFKKAVYQGEEDIDLLDPYIMMLNKVEDFLKGGGDKERLQLARRSFYIKVDEHLSELKKDKNWRQSLLSNLVKNWQWSTSDIQMIDQHEDWKIMQVIKERNSLIHEFKTSYRFLSNFVRKHVKSRNMIREADLQILGRKLYAAFERKAGKVDLIYRGITDNLFESHLSIHKLAPENGKEFWIAFSGVVAEKDVNVTTPLKRSFSLVELLSWCYFNRIVSHNTVIGLYNEDDGSINKEVKLIIENMEANFPANLLEENTIDDYRQPARVKANTTFINVGFDPLTKNRPNGVHITSDQSDALKYGSDYANLTISIDQILMTSWQEVLVFSYHGITGLMKCMKEYMQWFPPSQGRMPPAINANSFSSYRGTSISRRIERLFQSVYECFYTSPTAAVNRFILGIERQYYILRLEDDTLRYDRADSVDALMTYMSRPTENFSQWVFDDETLENHELSIIYEDNKQGEVQCFYEIKKSSVDVYIIDEMGTLIHQETSFNDVSTLIQHYSKFFESIHNRMEFVAQQNSHDQMEYVKNVGFYMLSKDRDGKKLITQQSYNQYIRPSLYVSLQVIVDLVDDAPGYTLFYEDQEFSTLEFGKNLYREVANKVLENRTSGERYDIYVTDIDLSPKILSIDESGLQTSRYLYYKRKIETKLKQALSQL